MEQPSVFYFRSPPVDVGPHPQLMQAALVVLGEPEESLTRLALEFSGASGFLTDEGRKVILSRVLSGDQEKVRFFSLLLDIGDHFLQKREGINGFLAYLEKSLSKPDGPRTEILGREELDHLKGLLLHLLDRCPAHLRHLKAERLAIATGLRTDSIDLICDLRPVFDQRREKVEGVMPFTTLKIVATGTDRFPVSFEAILSAGDVEDLLKKVKDAVAKLNALGRLAEQTKLPVPSVGLTETRE